MTQTKERSILNLYQASVFPGRFRTLIIIFSIGPLQASFKIKLNNNNNETTNKNIYTNPKLFVPEHG